MKIFQKIVLVAALLAVLAAGLLAAPGTASAHTTAAQTAQQAQKSDMGIRRYWNGIVVTLNRDEMTVLMVQGAPALIPALLAIPGIGWGAIAAIVTISGFSYWAVANHKCAWFWVSVDPSDGPKWGWYSC